MNLNSPVPSFAIACAVSGLAHYIQNTWQGRGENQNAPGDRGKTVAEVVGLGLGLVVGASIFYYRRTLIDDDSAKVSAKMGKVS